MNIKLKIIYSININDINKIIDSFKSDFDCLVEKTDDRNTFKIYIDNQLAFNLEDIFDDMNLNYIYLRNKIDKFQKNKLLKSNNNQVGGLGNIDFDEF